jgi:short-subunit dehydrogenase involved in D-alanine esterification of teichoic acids
MIIKLNVFSMKILITGGTHGMGKGVAKVLATKDGCKHEIIILCRSKVYGDAVVAELKQLSSNSKISYVLCDLTKLSDVKKAIVEIKRNHSYLDGIFINAGLGYAAQRVETADGMDPHFQVNYLSQFMLVLNCLSLLEKSQEGGRIIFNATEGGEIFWDDMQMKRHWHYEDGIHQAMTAKRMFLSQLHTIHSKKGGPRLSFIGFQIDKTVWTNQLAIIPPFMMFMATLAKLFGQFISIEECGEIIAPLLTEKQEVSIKRSGTFITWKNNTFVQLQENPEVLKESEQDRLWKISVELCKDEETARLSNLLDK